MDNPEEETCVPMLEPMEISKGTRECGLFDNLIAQISNEGYFEKRFCTIFNFFMVAIVIMPHLSVILAMSVPEHHCFIPERNRSHHSHLSESQWMDKMFPKEVLADTGKEAPSSCKMFKIGSDGEPTNQTQGCEWGWEYDHTWYQLTAPSMNNWVCDRQIYVANAFLAMTIGELIGNVCLGQLGDRVGRKPVYFISITAIIVGRVLAVFTSHHFHLFLVVCALGSVGNCNTATLVIGTEITGRETRARVASVQCMGHLVGSCAAPLLTWWLGDWRKAILATTLPCTFAFLFFRWMPESPRWLATTGRVERAMDVLGYIARVNGRELPDDTLTVLQKMAKKKEPTYGIPSLFNNKRLAKNSIMLIACWGCSGLLHLIMLLNAPNLAGNPFMNVFWQNLSALPGYVIGQIVSNRYGRRWSTTGSYFAVTLLTGVIILVHAGSSAWVTTTLVATCQMCMGVSGYVMALQAMEIFPTCVRESGTSCGGLTTILFCMSAPYIVHLGTTLDKRYPFFFTILLALVAALCSSALPETLNYRLSETLKDSANFGSDQKFWSFNVYKEENQGNERKEITRS